ncbi:hypothetical protein IKN40_03430 [bacterium]|jgi:hypothetical protein|nr:hypothetical protein [bacterium]
MFNAGTEYVTRRLESYEREVNFRKSLDNFFDNTEEGKEILNEMEKELDKVMEEELEKKTLPRLKEYAKTEDFSKLTDGQKEQINKVIEQLSTEA